MTGASRIWPWLALALAGLLALQSLRLANAQLYLAKAEVSQSKQAQSQAEQAQAATENKAVAMLNHGAAQQKNTHDYTQKLAKQEAGRAADATRIAGLQHDIRSAATRNAQLAVDAAACRGLADQYQRLAALAAEGAAVVSELVGLVNRRELQINTLKGQQFIDREVLERLQ